MTNEEKIKSMSTEELAEFFINTMDDYSIYEAFGVCPNITEVQKWLMQEAEE